MIESARFPTILVPVDFSRASRAAVSLAAELGRATGPVHVVLVHVCFVPTEIEALVAGKCEPVLEHLTKEASPDLEQILYELQDSGLSAEFLVLRGSPERVIVKLAQDKSADLIVMGTRGRTGLAHVALGSVAERVVRMAPCPVVTTKEDPS